jgi:hypothetical protein
MISMNFVEGLSHSGSANSILVVVDRFTKYGHFLPLRHPYTTFIIAKVFLDHIYKLHSMPSSIVLD